MKIKDFQSKRETYPEWKDLKSELFKLGDSKYKLENLKTELWKLSFYITQLIYFIDNNWEYLELKQKNLWLDEIDKRYRQQGKVFQPIWENLKIEWKDLKLKTEQEIHDLQVKINKFEWKQELDDLKLKTEQEIHDLQVKINKSKSKQEIDDLQSKITIQISNLQFKIGNYKQSYDIDEIYEIDDLQSKIDKQQEIDNLQSKIHRQIEDFKTKIKPPEEYWNSKIKEIKLRDARNKWFNFIF